MRGQIVDFDIIRIKQQIASAPKTTNVRAREDFIERRLRRRIKRVNPLGAIRKGTAQTPQQPNITQKGPASGLKELPKKTETPTKRKKISRRTKK